MSWLVIFGLLFLLMIIGFVFFAPVPPIDLNEISERLFSLRHDFRKLNDSLKSDEINKEDYEEELEELQRQVLELDKARFSYKEKPFPRNLVPSIAVLLSFFSVSTYLVFGSPWATDPEFLARHTRHERLSSGINMEKMAQALKKLESQLGRTRQDLESWVSLGLSYAYLGDWISAVRAYKVVDEINPNNAETLANLADFIAATQQMILEGEPERYIDRALQVDPNCVKALSLKATLCFNRTHYKDAISFWERELRNLVPESEEYRVIQGNIKEAKSLLK